VGLAHELAIQAATTGGGHPVPQLDAERANIGTASTFVALIAELWAHDPLRIRTAQWRVGR
jgi:beta-lactamase class A